MKEFKGAWHKVADGDLPELEERVLVSYKLEDKSLKTTVGYLKKFNIYEFETLFDAEVVGFEKGWITLDDCCFIELDKVIAWTELPEYEDEYVLHTEKIVI